MTTLRSGKLPFKEAENMVLELNAAADHVGGVSGGRWKELYGVSSPSEFALSKAFDAL